jgi:hypothetical protein
VKKIHGSRGHGSESLQETTETVKTWEAPRKSKNMKKQTGDSTRPAMDANGKGHHVGGSLSRKGDFMRAGTLLMTPFSHVATRNSIKGVMALWRFMPRNYSDFSDYEDSSDIHSFQPPSISGETQRSEKETARGQIVKAGPRQ